MSDCVSALDANAGLDRAAWIGLQWKFPQKSAELVLSLDEEIWGERSVKLD